MAVSVNLKNKGQLLYSATLCYIWLCSYFATLWRKLGVEDADIPNFFILLVLLFISRKKWIGRIRNSDVFLYVCLAFVYLFSVVIYPSTSTYLYENAFSVLCCTIPYIFIGELFQIKGYEGILTKASWLTIILNVLLLLSRSNSDAQEQMHKAYSLLPSVLFLFWQFIESHRKTDLVFLCVGLFLISSMGSRGPFVCFLFFAFTYFLFFKTYKYKNLARVIIVSVSLGLYLLSEHIAEFMIYLLSSFGMGTRIFDKMLQDSFINYESSSGRNNIHYILFKRLSEDSSGIGFGLFSDRMTADYYSHNIFIELWFSFGYYIGTFIILLFFLLVIRFYLKTTDRDNKVFALLLFTTSIIKLQFSASFITDTSFFFLIGFCIYRIREADKMKRFNRMSIKN